jgi:hypothetical protein
MTMPALSQRDARTRSAASFSVRMPDQVTNSRSTLKPNCCARPQSSVKKS